MLCRKYCTSRLTVSAFSCITADVWLTDCAVASVARTEVVTSPMARVICWVSRAVTSVLRLISLVAAFCCRSEEHTSELQSLMRISYAVFCLIKKTENNTCNTQHILYRALNQTIKE